MEISTILLNNDDIWSAPCRYDTVPSKKEPEKTLPIQPYLQLNLIEILITTDDD